MAQITTRTGDRVDAHLDSLIEAWRNVPKAAREIDQWDLIDQIDYVEEWGAKESLADTLRQDMASPETTPEQRARFDELQRLRQEYGALLKQLRLS